VKLLDLFSGAGGAGVGYARVGFTVTGVDLAPQPRYPFTFVQGDALAYLREHGAEYDVIHASPPCQRYSSMTGRWGRSGSHPDLVDPTRDLLQMSGRPYIIENVPGAPLRDPLMLCGTMFGLTGPDWHLRRHRIFETSVPLFPPASCAHRPGYAMAVYGHPGGSSRRDPRARFGSFAEWQAAMRIDWMNAEELAEAIPPAYTEWIGGALLRGNPLPISEAAI
jgi:DNA (cytosine-5)-methyltransferase 1